MTTRLEIPVAHALSSRHERRRRRALAWRERLPSIALGSAITVGLLGASAVALGFMGSAAEASPATPHVQNTLAVMPAIERTPYYCAAGDRYWWLRDDEAIGVDPGHPGAPDIRTSWTIEAGAMTTFSPSGYASYACRGE